MQQLHVHISFFTKKECISNDIHSACRENDVFSTSFFVSLDAYCILDTEKGSHISIPAWIGMWQS
ncbi:hypothetical protein, partial [Bacillus halotolerans]|uniref:hypothetical protein n=1 Tax=Bacillus halotolerans TaxID=260554 RepID=UPI001C63A687